MAASYETPATPMYASAEEPPMMFGNPALAKRAKQRRKLNPVTIGVPIAVLAIAAAGAAYFITQAGPDNGPMVATTSTTTTTTPPPAPLPVQAEALATPSPAPVPAPTVSIPPPSVTPAPRHLAANAPAHRTVRHTASPTAPSADTSAADVSGIAPTPVAPPAPTQTMTPPPVIDAPPASPGPVNPPPQT